MIKRAGNTRPCFLQKFAQLFNDLFVLESYRAFRISCFQRHIYGTSLLDVYEPHDLPFFCGQHNAIQQLVKLLLAEALYFMFVFEMLSHVL